MTQLYIDMKHLTFIFDEEFSYFSQSHYQKYLDLKELVYEHIAFDSLFLMHETAHSKNDVQ